MITTAKKVTRTLIGIATLLAALLALLLSAGDALATGVAPVITKAEASEMKRTSIEVCAEINSEGEETTYQISYRSEFGVTENTTALKSVGNGVTPVEECVQISGLEPNTTYFMTVSAKNATGENKEEVRTKGDFPKTVAVEGVETLIPTEVTAESATINGTLEPNGYDTHYYFEVIREKQENQPIFVPAKPGADTGSVTEAKRIEVALPNVGGNTEYTYRLRTENTFGTTEGESVSFRTPQAAPAVNGALLVRNVSGSSAGIAGTVTAQNETTAYWIEYAPESTFDSKAGNPYAGGATSAFGEIEATSLTKSTVLVGLEGLAPATTYHYRLVAKNGTGTSYGPDNTFSTTASTPPIVATGAAGGISATTATIYGTVNPRGLKTSYEFQIGQTPEYGGAEIFGNAGEGEAAETVATAFQYLIPGTTYHYRIVAVNEDGTVYGADQTFTTPGVASPIVQAPNAPLIAFTPIAFPTEKEAAPVKTKTKTKNKSKKKSKKKHSAKHSKQAARKGKSKKKK